MPINREKNTLFSWVVTPELLNEIKRVAERERRSVSAQLAYFAEKCLKEYEVEHGQELDRSKTKSRGNGAI